MYDKSGEVIDSGPDMGTYNYSNPFGDNGEANISDIDDVLDHYLDDVRPHNKPGGDVYDENISEIYDDKPKKGSGTGSLDK